MHQWVISIPAIRADAVVEVAVTGVGSFGRGAVAAAPVAAWDRKCLKVVVVGWVTE